MILLILMNFIVSRISCRYAVLVCTGVCAHTRIYLTVPTLGQDGGLVCASGFDSPHPGARWGIGLCKWI